VSEVLIIVAVVAVLAVIVTVVFLRRRRPARAGGGEEPAAIEPPAGAGPAAREEARGEAAVPTRATGEAVTGAAEAEAVASQCLRRVNFVRAWRVSSRTRSGCWGS